MPYTPQPDERPPSPLVLLLVRLALYIERRALELHHERAIARSMERAG